jgi:hypothetical protein
MLGAVGVALTAWDTAVIAPPGSFGLGFTTNFLSTPAEDSGSNVVLTFPAGTRAAGIYLAAPAASGVSVTMTDDAGGGWTTTLRSDTVGFVGFTSPDGIRTIRLSSPTSSVVTAVANVGDILYSGPR